MAEAFCALRFAASASYSASERYTTFIQACAISSTVRSPQPTHWSGSGLLFFAVVLSCHAVTLSSVPLGSSAACTPPAVKRFVRASMFAGVASNASTAAAAACGLKSASAFARSTRRGAGARCGLSVGR